ncbi:MAG: hypothetical protein ACJ73Y_02610 [Rubrobacteraceae bacterium]
MDLELVAIRVEKVERAYSGRVVLPDLGSGVTQTLAHRIERACREGEGEVPIEVAHGERGVVDALDHRRGH